MRRLQVASLAFLCFLMGLFPISAYGISLIDFNSVFFKAGRPIVEESLEDSIANETAFGYLKETIMVLKKFPDVTIDVVGNVDGSECSEAHQCDALAFRRAVLVHRYLLDAGIDAKRIISLTRYPVLRRNPIIHEDKPTWNQRVDINLAFDPTRKHGFSRPQIAEPDPRDPDPGARPISPTPPGG